MEAEVPLHGGTTWAWHNHLHRKHHKRDTPRAPAAVEQRAYTLQLLTCCWLFQGTWDNVECNSPTMQLPCAGISTAATYASHSCEGLLRALKQCLRNSRCRPCILRPACWLRVNWLTCRELLSSATVMTLVAPFASSAGNSGLTRTTTLMLSSASDCCCCCCGCYTQVTRTAQLRQQQDY
jgi:hypothetical protein